MELQGAYEDIQAQGAELVAISVDTLDGAQQMWAHAGAEFPVLADPTTEVVRRYGIFDLLDDGVSAPATFIVQGGGVFVAGHVGQDIADRVPAEAIVEALRTLKEGPAAGRAS